MKFEKLVKQILTETVGDTTEIPRINREIEGRPGAKPELPRSPKPYHNPPDQISLEQWYHVFPNQMKSEYPEADFILFVGPDKEPGSFSNPETAMRMFFRDPSNKQSTVSIEDLQNKRYKVTLSDSAKQREVIVAGPVKLKSHS